MAQKATKCDQYIKLYSYDKESLRAGRTVSKIPSTENRVQCSDTLDKGCMSHMEDWYEIDEWRKLTLHKRYATSIVKKKDNIHHCQMWGEHTDVLGTSSYPTPSLNRHNNIMHSTPSIKYEGNTVNRTSPVSDCFFLTTSCYGWILFRGQKMR